MPLPRKSRIKVTPPDGGWGWCVVVAAFMANFVAGGVSYTVGEFVDKITNEFAGGDVKQTAWIVSLMAGMTYGAGPVSSALVNAYGCRITTIVGSIFAGTGFCISYFGKGPGFFIFSIGFLGGLGFGLTYLPAIVAVSKWFGKRRAFATGVAVSGAGFGTAGFAALEGHLLRKYSLGISFIIVGAILFLCIIFALFFTTVKTKTSPMTTNLDESQSETPSQALVEDQPKKSDTISQEKSLPAQLLPPKGGPKGVAASRASLAPAAAGNNNLIHFKVQTASTTKRSTLFKTLKCLRLLLNPVFLIFAISNFLSTIGYMVPYAYLVEITQQMSCSSSNNDSNSTGTTTETPSNEDAHLLSFVGISNGICAIALGYLSDKTWVNRLYVYNVSLMMCGSVPHVVSDYAALVACSIVFGATFGISLNLSSVICVDLLGLAKLTNAFGLLLVFQGAGTLLGPPIVAGLHGISCSYKWGFGLTGGFVCLSGLMLFFVPMLQRRRKSNPDGSSEESSGEPEPEPGPGPATESTLSESTPTASQTN